MQWDDLRHFLAVAREGTLSGAARRLALNATTVGRRLSALEEEVGAKLFDRTPEGYLLSQAGRELLPSAQRMEDEALALERRISGADARLSGTVRVAATEMIATRFLAPKLSGFHREHPEIQLDLVCTQRKISLARREADIALRLSRPHEDNLITRRLSSIELGLYGSRGYLERFGMPEQPDDGLPGHNLILFADTRAFRIENQWFSGKLDNAQVVLRSDSVSSIYAAAVAAIGLALLPCSVADADPRLVRVETSTSPEPRMIWQTVHRDLAKNARVRVVLGFLSAALERKRQARANRCDA